MFEWIRLGGKGDCEKNSSPYCFHNLFNKLIANDSFKKLFINHAVIIYQSYVNAATTSIQIDRKIASIPKKEIDRDMLAYPRNPGIVLNVCGIVFDYENDCTKRWAKDRDKSVREEFRNEFNLGEDIAVNIVAEGNGQVLVDGMPLPSKTYQAKFFANNNLSLFAVAEKGGQFVEWSDGVKDNPREVTPFPDTTFTAIFTN